MRPSVDLFLAVGPRALPEHTARDVSHLGELLRLFWSAVGGDSDSAAARGMRLFKANLTPAQLEQYEQHGYFELIGGDTGRRYRIRRGTTMNIDEMDESGRLVKKWCFVPTGNLVAGDVYLAQKCLSCRCAWGALPPGALKHPGRRAPSSARMPTGASRQRTVAVDGTLHAPTCGRRSPRFSRKVVPA